MIQTSYIGISKECSRRDLGGATGKSSGPIYLKSSKRQFEVDAGL